MALMKPLYLDHAATTPLDPRVVEALKPYLTTSYGNPGSVHTLGREAKKALDDARVRVGRVLKCASEEIIFVSSGTESVNLALKGVAHALKDKGKHLITSVVEHPAVLETCKHLETEGFSVTYLPVDQYGIVSALELEKAIRKDTILVSLMYANNEIGTINPVNELASVARKHGVLFHTDACQAGSLDLNVDELGVDLLTLNGSKIYGPKGVGILFKRKSVMLCPLLHGGGQEMGLRSGTENVPGAVGFAKALELIQQEKETENKRLTILRDFLIKNLGAIPGTRINGHLVRRLPSNVNVSFSSVDGESLIEALDAEGIYVSAGSACSSFTLEPSHVILALGVDRATAHGTVRFSLGKETTKEDVERAVESVKRIVQSLREKIIR